MARDSVGHTMLVATVLCVVCSVLVASAAVGLRGRQEANKQLEKKKNVLIAAGLYNAKENSVQEVDTIFTSSIEHVLIDLKTGKPVDPAVVDPQSYDQREAARNPKLSVPINPPNALGGIKRREKYAFVYQVKNADGSIQQVVLPVYGKGLWSTLYGFLAVDADDMTIRGITFYEEAETPGLGGEVENPRWKALWVGKKLFDDQGNIKIHVIKGTVLANSPDAQYEIDGLSGATMTSNGVDRLVRYWVGPDAFGPYLQNLRQEKLRASTGGGSSG